MLLASSQLSYEGLFHVSGSSSSNESSGCLLLPGAIRSVCLLVSMYCIILLTMLEFNKALAIGKGTPSSMWTISHLFIWCRKFNFSVYPSRSKQCGIQDVDTVSCHDNLQKTINFVTEQASVSILTLRSQFFYLIESLYLLGYDTQINVELCNLVLIGTPAVLEMWIAICELHAFCDHKHSQWQFSLIGRAFLHLLFHRNYKHCNSPDTCGFPTYFKVTVCKLQPTLMFCFGSKPSSWLRSSSMVRWTSESPTQGNRQIL